jgi:hypothetical protein
VRPIPYGNSRAVPYAEQFFIGVVVVCVHSVRVPLGQEVIILRKSSLEANESGELKLELNAEIRNEHE